MKRYRLLPLVLLWQFLSFSTAAQSKQFKALLVTTTRGWHHESLHYGVVALEQLAMKHSFSLVLFEDPNSFTDAALASYQVIIFLNTTGDIFDSSQQRVMERFIQAGKGFVGIHSASDTEYDWDWYNKLVGRMFKIHPAIQTAKAEGAG
ncbi:MAG: ThuA domain-containing protein [Flavisolibacter sp.]